MADIKWIKITTDLFEDEKIKMIDSLPESDAVLVIWLKLLTLAGKKNEGGSIAFTEKVPYSDEMLSTVFNRPLNTVRLALKTFQQFEMIEISSDDFIYITNWEKHQNIEGLDKIREQNRLRQQKRRSKMKQLQERNATSRDSNALDKEEDKDKDKEEEKKKKKNTYSASFEAWFQNYPKKKKKGDAYKAWNTFRPDEDLQKIMTDAVEQHKKTAEWKKDDGQYIPYPASWIRGRCWEDEIEIQEDIEYQSWDDLEKELRDAGRM